MRRWLMILFVVMLPLQFSWAAVAKYCEHEKSPAAASHFGHHEHEHEHHGPAQAQPDHGDQQSAAGLDDDCGFCHLGCAQLLRAEPGGALALFVTPRVALHPSLHDSVYPAVLERPDRRLA